MQPDIDIRYQDDTDLWVDKYSLERSDLLLQYIFLQLQLKDDLMTFAEGVKLDFVFELKLPSN